ncbi:hypothetical protein SBP02_11865 [Pseudomonas benzenivorans]|uniref:Uncharacterized protein n=1 Tax=Pseudomonas benzenivorans TaxID=556533 RepID=A0ABZ0PQW0_9PSED|nr:hypothetical protein [Pseudomonas benzenivorans]WPC03481.1 hypothetical protein SBP02_11865 [Pseudomonas benzenivorans]
MKHIYIDSLSIETATACGLYLVGGFDSEKNHLPALPIFRPGKKERLYDVCALAEAGCYDSRRCVENLIIQELFKADEVIIGHTHYHFNIKSFTSQRALDYLVYEVLAQVNED